jgi:hypothetical protein
MKEKIEVFLTHSPGYNFETKFMGLVNHGLGGKRNVARFCRVDHRRIQIGVSRREDSSIDGSSRICNFFA